MRRAAPLGLFRHSRIGDLQTKDELVNLIAPQSAQPTAAHLVGSIHLVAMLIGILSESIRGRLIVPSEAALTAQQLAGHETLFRLCVGGDLPVPILDSLQLCAHL